MIPPRTPDRLAEDARRGREAFERHVRPHLRPEDDGKFVAIDMDTGAYEIDLDEYAAIMRLRARVPAADIWLERAGSPAAIRIGSAR